MGEIGQLEDEAMKRKQRLAAIKRKVQGGNEGGPDKKATDENELPKPIFRSYKPITEELSDNVLPKAEPADVGEAVKGELENTSAVVMEELDFMNLAPRKPDWDLKRDIAKKLEKLEKRTSRAIGEIIRDRLKIDDLADAVNVGASHAAAAGDDD
eukprot:TRINITY_DN13680_c0_g1_i1.p1 TRINITY_DN13680_c0_g1~~TRINITY_DN13680_c0_g1_i1.p1  ORF type:complete len:155 (+),score=23.42 TRINITY_DN13680_c0_g1_i1:57-521(+)